MEKLFAVLQHINEFVVLSQFLKSDPRTNSLIWAANNFFIWLMDKEAF
jgi:hypothetical protein